MEILDAPPDKPKRAILYVELKSYKYIKFLYYDIVSFNNKEVIKGKIRNIVFENDVKTDKIDADVFLIEVPYKLIELIRRYKDDMLDGVVEIYKNMLDQFTFEADIYINSSIKTVEQIQT